MKKQFAENKIELGGGIANDFDFEGLDRNGGGSTNNMGGGVTHDFEGLDRNGGGSDTIIRGGGTTSAPRLTLGGGSY